MTSAQVVSLLLALAPYLVPVLVSVLTVVVKAALDRLPASKRAFVKGIVHTAVVAVEQLADATLNGAGKKQMAAEFVQRELAHYHISVPASVISALIEEAVAALPSK